MPKVSKAGAAGNDKRDRIDELPHQRFAASQSLSIEPTSFTPMGNCADKTSINDHLQRQAISIKSQQIKLTQPPIVMLPRLGHAPKSHPFIYPPTQYEAIGRPCENDGDCMTQKKSRIHGSNRKEDDEWAEQQNHRYRCEACKTCHRARLHRKWKHGRAQQSPYEQPAQCQSFAPHPMSVTTIFQNGKARNVIRTLLEPYRRKNYSNPASKKPLGGFAERLFRKLAARRWQYSNLGRSRK